MTPQGATHTQASSAKREESQVTTRPVPPRQLMLLALGFGVWCSALVILYAYHALGCAFAWPAGALRLGMGLILLAHLALIGLLWRSYAKSSPDPALGPTGSFLHWVVVWTLI